MAAAARQPSNLPVSTSSFIGRGREISEVKRLLASTRLLTLTGPGGCGKTRTALQLAAHISEEYTAGVWFAELAAVTNPALVPQAIAVVLGLHEQSDRPIGDVLLSYLRDRKVLLILDNCEHVLAASAELAASLLKHCPHLQLVATSREPLNVAGETTWLVTPLALPHPQLAVQLEQLAEVEAVQLFVARAQAALPAFQLTGDNASLVAQICRRLDGIPLAIELAAARVKLLDVSQIADRLDDSLQLLARGSSAAPPRHQTMRAALDWSYRLLAARERILFRRLAVFAGSFTLEAVEAIDLETAAAADGAPAPNILDVLSNLVDKSLVLVAEREPGEAVRYRLLEPVRQYALEQLRTTDEEMLIQERQLTYAIVLTEKLEPSIKNQDQLLSLRRLDKEQDNWRTALAWSIHASDAIVDGLRLATSLQVYWQRRSYWSEGRRWLQQAIAAYDVRHDLQSPIGDRYLARAIVAEGWLAYHQGDFAGRLEALGRAMPLLQAQDDLTTTALALSLQAQLTSYADNLADALSLSEASVASARQSGDRWTLAWADYIRGMIVYRRDEAAARASLNESIRLFRAVGDKRSIAACLNVLGYITANAGQHDMARGLFEEALTIGSELGDRDLQTTELSNLANLARLQGDVGRAAELYAQALTEARELDKRAQIATSLEGLGHTHLLQGDLVAARQFMLESLRLVQEIEFEAGIPVILGGLSRIAAAQGHTLEAARMWGAIDAYLTSKAGRLDADVQATLEQDQAAVRATLTSADFAANFAAGHDWTLTQACRAVEDLLQRHENVTVAVPRDHRLQLCAFGATQVLANGQALTSWPYARVKELLFYLTAFPTRTKAQIGLALWPQASPAQLRNSLGTTLYHLRRVLGDPQWIVFEDDVYRFNRGLPYYYDVEEFEANLTQAGRSADHTPDRAVALLQQALALYQGDFVEDFLEGDWFLLRRENLRQKYVEALLDLARLLFSRREYASAAEFYRRVIDRDEFYEQAHRELMRCYVRLGERGQALRHYQTLEQLMYAELGSAPAAESAALYDRLKRGEEI